MLTDAKLGGAFVAWRITDTIDSDVDDARTFNRVSVSILAIELLENRMFGRGRNNISMEINASHVVMAEGKDLNTLNEITRPLLEDKHTGLGRIQARGVIVSELADIIRGSGRLSPLAGHKLSETDDATALGRRTDLTVAFILDAEFPIVISTITMVTISEELEFTITGIFTDGSVTTTDVAGIIGKGLN